MSDAWEEYFTGPVSPAEGGVNWDAYSHDELYQMLWQDADVADVSTVATEWAKHRAALSTHATVLREQCVALQHSWQGPSAEEAVKRLEALAARVEKISELAGAGGQAAQDAADALATARAMMPPPPGNPTAPLTDAVPGATGAPAMSTPPVPFVPAAPTSSSIPSLDEYMASMESYLSSMQSSLSSSLSSAPSSEPSPSFTPAPAPTPMATSTTPSDMGTAFGAVGSGGFSFYMGTTAQDQQKAQAVRAMQNYESSLTSSSQLLGEARSNFPAAAPLPRAESTSPAAAAQGGPGVPWQRLVGAAPAGGLRTGAGTVPITGGPGAANGASLGPGGRVGALLGTTGGPGMPGAHLGAESAAARAAGHGGMVPPIGGQRGGSEDERHENRMPTLNHGLFAVDEPAVTRIAGLNGEQQ